MIRSALLLLLSASIALADADPTFVITNARYVSTLTKTDLEGKLKKGSTSFPVKLYMRGKDIQLRYLKQKENTWAGIHLQLNQSSCELFDVVGSKMTPFPSSKIGQQIQGTDITYEDISLRFLYWPTPSLLYEESVKTQTCYVIRVFNPDQRGNYKYVDLWIHKKSYALMKVKAYDRANKHIKTLEAADLMNVDGDIMMKKMKVQTIENGRTKSISYLIFENPEGVAKSRPRKLR